MNDGKEEMENVGSGEKEDQPCSEATMGSISQGQQLGGGQDVGDLGLRRRPTIRT